MRAAAFCMLALVPSTAGAQANIDALFDLLCGRSVHFYDTGGNQIEYTSGDGTAYLWHHDAQRVIVGEWGVYSNEDAARLQNNGAGESREGDLSAEDLFDSPSFGAQVCYQYPAGSFSVLDTGGYHCFDEVLLFETVVEGGVFPGDRYGLKDGEPPFPLPEHPFLELESFDADFPQLTPEPACGLPIS